MTPLLGISIVVAFLSGWVLVSVFWPGSSKPWMPIAVLALPAGWALTSVLYFYWLLVSGGQGSWYPAFELVLLGVAMALSKKFFGNSGFVNPLKCRLQQSTALVTMLLVAAASFCFSITVKIASINTWGRWDAWSRINAKARFLYGGGEHWTWIFESSRIPHNDYPLLLEAVVARTWAWMGGIAPLGPQVLSVVWGGWSLLALYAMAAWLRGPVPAAMAGLGYLTFMPLLFLSAIQYACIPLACNMILGCAMVVAAQQYPKDARSFGFLAGFFSGAAAWCKNEGIAFLAIVILWWWIIVALGRITKTKGATRWFLAGTSIAGSAVLVVKAILSGTTETISDATSSVFSLALDIERHGIILDKLRQGILEFWAGWPLLLLALAYVLHHLWRRSRVADAGVLFCTTALASVYYLALLSTHYDLSWHIDTSLNRLLLQLWPVFLLGAVVLFEKESM